MRSVWLVGVALVSMSSQVSAQSTLLGALIGGAPVRTAPMGPSADGPVYAPNAAKVTSYKYKKTAQLTPGDCNSDCVVQFSFEASAGTISTYSYLAFKGFMGGGKMGRVQTFDHPSDIIAVALVERKGMVYSIMSSTGVSDQLWHVTELPVLLTTLPGAASPMPDGIFARFRGLSGKALLGENRQSGERYVFRFNVSTDGNQADVMMQDDKGRQRSFDLSLSEGKIYRRSREDGSIGTAEMDVPNGTIWFTLGDQRLGLTARGGEGLAVTTGEQISQDAIENAMTMRYYRITSTVAASPVSEQQANRALADGAARQAEVRAARMKVWGVFAKLADADWHYGNAFDRLTWAEPGVTLSRKIWTDDALSGPPTLTTTMRLNDATGTITVEQVSANGAKFTNQLTQNVYGEVVSRSDAGVVYYKDLGPNEVQLRRTSVAGREEGAFVMERVGPAALARYQEKTRLATQARERQAAESARQAEIAAQERKQSSGGGFFGTLLQLGGAAAGMALTNGSTAGAMAGASVFAKSDEERQALMQGAQRASEDEQAQRAQEQQQQADFQAGLRRAQAQGEAVRQARLAQQTPNAPPPGNTSRAPATSSNTATNTGATRNAAPAAPTTAARANPQTVVAKPVVVPNAPVAPPRAAVSLPRQQPSITPPQKQTIRNDAPTVTDQLAENVWRLVAEVGGVNVYVTYRHELRDQVISTIKLENTNDYSVYVGIQPRYICRDGSVTHGTAGAGNVPAHGSTSAGYYDYVCRNGVPSAGGFEYVAVTPN